MSAEEDRRRAKRVPVSVGFSEADPRTSTPVANLSYTGVMVVGEATHPVGSHIEVRFVACPEDPVLFVHSGTVVRHLEDGLGMGVEFDPLSPETEALLLDVLERLQRQLTPQTRRQARRFDVHALRTRVLEED
ncbi:PilZ domain-containing protein [Paraliomyxa miuraensis]|uniref:PilZ domain-containing protein n=1 Tax=Paraliomyxa miuraensis TaxID=376150 RepID=UPI002256F9AF|nr:PilZ domain-containing protein [Paraliomyxa miuraensis]MCX4240366.1 PilZ domain-containing protein [Paraliomyxa miuraensis]